MSLWFCPVCGDMWKSESKPFPCPNTLSNQCHASLLLPCIKHYKDPLANNYEMDIEFMESLK